ncbi:MAG: hypothetical protein R3D84_05950 [Paracoccaceae bacterium]
MHWKGLFLAITTMLASVPAVAAPPDQSPRPVPRPVMETPGNALVATVPVPRPDLAAASTSGLRHSTGPRVTARVPTRPQPRPAAVAQRPVALSAPHVGIGQSLRPRARSDAEVTLAAASLAPVQPGKVKPSKKGAVCGDPAIKGQTIAPITSRVKGCGWPTRCGLPKCRAFGCRRPRSWIARRQRR